MLTIPHKARNGTTSGQTPGIATKAGSRAKQAQNEAGGGQEKAKTPSGAGWMCNTTSTSISGN
jgi:hypothetical protein